MFIWKPVVTFLHLNPLQIYRHHSAWHVLIISFRLWLYFLHLDLFVRVKVCVRVYACGRGLPTLISVCPVVCNAPRLVIGVYLDELIGRDRAADADEWVTIDPAAWTFPTYYDKCVSNSPTDTYVDHAWGCGGVRISRSEDIISLAF